MTAPAFANFRDLARGHMGVPQKHTILPDTTSPGVSITQLFNYQSYFDSTLLQNAILPQSVNEPIVDSTLQKANIGGYSFGLHPSSQCPVAIQPTVGGQGASSQAIILRPGQIYRPHGMPGGNAGNFSGFRWGLPFGWLGGGVATLYVFPSADADVAWPGNAEVLFHRQRMLVYGLGGSIPAAATPAPKNWPLRFPWTQAARGATQITQAGAAIVSISDPTRIEMSLRMITLANPNTMRIFFNETNDFDLDSAGAVIPTPVRFIDYVWGTYASDVNLAGTYFDTAYPVVELTGEICRLAADDGGLLLWALTGSAGEIDGQYVDICRYGRI
jgi:hypothetical protein